ncbi:hypothetical protein PV327_001423 [Microctonus hyperodae]|uniref:Set2 Rpb1 interacting domain-containing protein n=1 Tax=Microctonus hyperodae TaxID=165561 RepID=A0AA39G872_MICHY|nr:hypothetical protein PV327_001423 [Microctonus hyperodae]
MTATKPLDLPLPLEIKKEKEESMSENDESEDTENDDDDNDEEDDDGDDDEDDSNSSLLQPSILDKDHCFSQVETQNEFLHLNSLVRRVYFSYLHKSIINNYNVCATEKNENISRSDLKKFASRLELGAVKASLEASLYRQAMLQIISDVKDNTKQRKIHKKLAMYLESPPTTASIGIQTCFETDPVEKKTIHSISNDSKCLSDEKVQEPKCKLNNVDEKLLEIFHENRISTDNNLPIMHIKDNNEETIEILKENVEKNIKINQKSHHNNHHQENINAGHNVNTSVHDIFGESSEEHNPIQNDEEESRDSLIQHLEDMFCESEDSSDLTTLIEKHSGITKSNIDSEINKMCGESISFTLKENDVVKPLLKESAKLNITAVVQETSGKRKLSFSNYKKMKKRAQAKAQGEEIIEDKQTKKMRGIWFVERVHQVSKLKAKMMELSMRNYRKHGRLREKFLVLFGESDEQEMMPDSPIHIEEHLTACKERIAPWVVKYLMPYYTKKIIQDRLLFKTVAKHIADMLIIENTFPEEECVNQYVKNYFRNKTCIKLESDIYI